MILPEILKRVSRSFYLTIRILPEPLRSPIGLAYLFCRTADTLADTPLISPGERLKVLEMFRTQFQSPEISWEIVREIRDRAAGTGGEAGERLLLGRLEDCFIAFQECPGEDRARIRWLVSTLTQGMEMDLTCFPVDPNAPLVALETEEDLDRYCYFVAGCVGDFWTRMAVAHIPSLDGWDEGAMRERGIRFGKGLQMTNVIKDLSRDLARGRCYPPKTLLDRLGLAPADLVPGLPPERYRPLLVPLIRIALDHLEVGREYALSVPRRSIRLRLACLWPLLFALKTVLAVYRSDRLLDPGATIKISRAEVYSVMAATAFFIYSDRVLNHLFNKLKQEVMEAIDRL